MTVPTVRVHLLTYRRHTLLRRALDCLRAQTYKHWICDIHNDDPFDPFPGELAKNCADPRINVVNHQQNLGVVETFNLLFRPVPEAYLSVLEDDNSWDQNFLEVMVGLMEHHLHVAAGWANQRYWHEQCDGSWELDGKCVSHRVPGEGPRVYYWPSLGNMVGAVHSQGAVLWRTVACHALRIPSQVSSSCMEAFRERMTSHPILFYPQPLANFAVTQQTARSGDAWRYTRDQVALLGSFLAVVAGSKKTLHQGLQGLRAGWPYRGHLVLLAALALPGCRFLLRYARWRDWYYLLRTVVRRPLQTCRILWFQNGARPLYRWLLPLTRERLLEAHANGYDDVLRSEWFERSHIDKAPEISPCK